MSKKKIRVLYVVGGISHEGIGSFVLNVFENINKEEIEISFALATRYHQAHEDRIIKQGGIIYRTDEIGDGIKGKINHFFSLIKLIKEKGPFDVVHTHMDFFNGINLLAANIAKVPMRISHAHLAISSDELKLSKKSYNSFMKFLIRVNATKKIGCSKQANNYMNGISEYDVNNKVICNAIDMSKFKSNYLKNETNKKVINFITVGRIEEQKNPLFIVDIINELIKINKNIHLYWIGVGSLENEVLKNIGKYNLSSYITLLGRRDDIDCLLRKSDFMLLPSKWEGTPIVLIESQVSNIPCFISDTITDEADLGLCTIISLKESAKEWAERINVCINNKTYNNILNYKKLRKFDIKTSIKDLEKIYQI